METKRCNGPLCKGKDLPLNSFGKSGKYHKSQCRQCYAASMRKDPDAKHREWLRRVQQVMMRWEPPRMQA